MDNKNLKINYKDLTDEQRDKLDNYEHNKKQLEKLQDITDITQDLSYQFDKLIENKDLTDIGALLLDMRESLDSIKNKEDVEFPNFTKPVTDAFTKLELSIGRALKEVAKQPEIHVDAPPVNVSAPSVDLKGIEKLLKGEIPKAFKEAIAQIPKTEMPAYPDRWDEVLKWLQDIDTGTRMKPLPGKMNVTNPDGTPVSPALINVAFDTIQITSYNSNNDPLIVVYRTGGAAGTIVATLTITYDVDFNITEVVRT
jgi:hypothetical protein